MAVLFRSKFPSESVYIPGSHRFISFVNGEYSTADAEEIAVLASSYEHITERDDSPEIVSDIPDRVENEDISATVKKPRKHRAKAVEND